MSIGINGVVDVDLAKCRGRARSSLPATRPKRNGSETAVEKSIRWGDDGHADALVELPRFY